MNNRKLRMGMIGGGPGSFIGAVHRIAANLDGLIELVCGSFSSNHEKSLQTGKELCIPEHRLYATYAEMIEAEKLLPEGERMDFVSIVTPNHVHFEPAKLALENGFHVVLDKPIALNLAEAEALTKIAASKDLLFCLTHTYTGYPMIKEAREQVLSGKFGKIRKVYVEYPQGWLSKYEEGGENKQASWRTDPSKSGIAGAMGDIGTHAFNLAEYVTGLSVTKICADVNTVVEGRLLDDDATVLLKFNNGGSGCLIASQVAAGDENNVKIRVYGEIGGLEWQQDIANTLLVKWLDKPTEVYRTGGPGTSAVAQHNTRVPSGHPEGYLEAFGNLYRNFALSLKAFLNGAEAKAEWLDFPGAKDGLRGMQFVQAVIDNSSNNEKWTSL